MTNPLYTIGHSNRGLDEFIDLLARAGIECLADIRTVPRSRSNPQFNRDTLPETLADRGIAYEHMADLGGLRGKSKTVPADEAMMTFRSSLVIGRGAEADPDVCDAMLMACCLPW